MAANAEYVSIWWRNHVLNMKLRICEGSMPRLGVQV